MVGVQGRRRLAHEHRVRDELLQAHRRGEHVVERDIVSHSLSVSLLIRPPLVVAGILGWIWLPAYGVVDTESVSASLSRRERRPSTRWALPCSRR